MHIDSNIIEALSIVSSRQYEYICIACHYVSGHVRGRPVSGIR